MSDAAAPVTRTRRIRLVIADDHPVVVAGLDGLLSLEPDLEILARATNGDEALCAVRQFQPDILILDLRMPDRDGLSVLREMRRERSGTRIVVLTGVDGDDVLEAIHLGAHGLVMKDMATKLLVRCIREVHAGRKWLDRDSATRTVDKLLKREASMQACARTLTPRELEIACLTARGMPNKAVAEQLSITEGTAKLHLHHVYQKLNVDGRMGLVRHLRSCGLD
jgi:DNA-binding NarL/FixJ family response regulator